MFSFLQQLREAFNPVKSDSTEKVPNQAQDDKRRAAQSARESG